MKVRHGTGSVWYELGLPLDERRTNTEPGAVATGSSEDTHKFIFATRLVINHHPVATTTPRGLPARGPRSAPGSVFVNRRFRNSA